MTAANDIAEYALLRLMPPPEYATALKVESVLVEKAVNGALKTLGLLARCSIQGSVAKGTWVGKTADIDCFIHLPLDTDPEFFDKAAYQIAESAFGPGTIMEKKVSSHPYVTILHGEFEVDIVPCYAVANATEIASAVDRTPFHTAWVNSHLTTTQKQEVRKLKLFLQGTELYGADTWTGGFSGYACEVLVEKYGSFEDVLANIKENRLDSVLLDPTDPVRNLLASVSESARERIYMVAHRYMKKPSFDYFTEGYDLSDNKLSRIFQNCVHIKVTTPLSQEEAASLRSSLKSMVASAQQYGFTVYRETYTLKDNHFNAYIMGNKLDTFRKHISPDPMKFANAYSAWREKWDNREDAIVGFDQETGVSIAMHVEPRPTMLHYVIGKMPAIQTKHDVMLQVSYLSPTDEAEAYREVYSKEKHG